jgi:hypothetical protein
MGNLKVSVATDATPVNKLAEIESQFLKLQGLMKQKASLSKVIGDAKTFHERVNENSLVLENDNIQVVFKTGYNSTVLTLANEPLIKLLTTYLLDVCNTKLELLNDQIQDFKL